MRSTVCPHDEFLTSEEARQKDLALSLLGKDVRFAHQADGPTYRVMAVGRTGMVSLAEMVGEFAPHLFVQPAA